MYHNLRGMRALRIMGIGKLQKDACAQNGRRPNTEPALHPQRFLMATDGLAKE